MMHRCGKCLLTFNSIQLRDEHRTLVHNDDLEKISAAKGMYKKQQLYVLCVHCGKNVRKHYYDDHLASHLNLRHHKCPYCNAGFNSVGNKYAHMRQQHQGKPRVWKKY